MPESSIDAMLSPFARVPGSNDMSEERAQWKRRREVMGLLHEMKEAIFDAMDDLNWKDLAPERSEQEARPHLERLRALACEHFGLEEKQ